MPVDFVSIRQRAQTAFDCEGLGTPAFALAGDVFTLLADMALRDQQDYRAKFDAVSRTNDALEYERDEARELHAAVCAKYADAIVRLRKISRIIVGYQVAHGKDNVAIIPDREAVAKNGKYVGTIPAAVNE
jgi:hypothetical protein